MADCDYDYDIREATMGDMDDVMSMIQELADFEKMPDGPKINAEVLRADAFGAKPSFRCIVAERSKPKASQKNETREETSEANETKLVGYALFFYTYSTWEGKAILLEDLYVKPEFRKYGLGKRMFQKVALIAKEENCSRLDLHVLDWNPARKAYEAWGLRNLTELEGWHFYRLDSDGINSICM